MFHFIIKKNIEPVCRLFPEIWHRNCKFPIETCISQDRRLFTHCEIIRPNGNLLFHYLIHPASSRKIIYFPHHLSLEFIYSSPDLYYFFFP